MLKMIKGAKIKDADKLSEGYQVIEGDIRANIDADKMAKVFKAFLKAQKDPLFLILEVPASADDEKAKDGIVKHFHTDVYYLDNIPSEAAIELFGLLGNLFINDGLSQIGFGNFVTQAEIMTQKYNVVDVHPGKDDLGLYEKILSDNGIEKVDSLKTAWDYFTSSNPGASVKIEEDGKTVYDIVGFLQKEAGLYLAETRESD